MRWGRRDECDARNIAQVEIQHGKTLKYKDTSPCFNFDYETHIFRFILNHSSHRARAGQTVHETRVLPKPPRPWHRIRALPRREGRG